MKSAIVVVIDRLGARYLGPYGNTWLDTPQFNRLASQSLLCETALADSPDLALAYRAWWTGRHVLETAITPQSLLPHAARQAGLSTVLVTDEPLVAELPGAASFAERIVLPAEPVSRAADEFELAGLGKLFLAAIERLRSASEPALVWIHSRGMAGPWDAPSALRQQFADEDDPAAPDFVDPPRTSKHADDPDVLLGYVHAYAGQVALVDACLGSLLDALDDSTLREEALLAVTSPRGYPLGEHSGIGGNDLYGELLEVPLWLRLPGGVGALARTQRLVQPCDLAATLIQWLDLPPQSAGGFATSLLPIVYGEDMPPRELAAASGREEWAVRSPAWLLRSAVVDDEVYRKLFAKPDDRWEVNEVASRCGEVVEQLAAASAQFSHAAAAGTLASLPPLPEILTDTRR
ncbi:MAG: sulfatase-like hydrolase/transferase [Planctomycetaceae bacterium]|nr:sulfatase-like hydrolase/transferase [Planctomycetaceae bacterium]